jgi:hypothetical protein
MIKEGTIEYVDTKEYLRDISERHPATVTGSLKKGDKVRKSLGLLYNIDNVNIDKKLGNFPKGAVPYGEINRALKSDMGGILRVFGDRFEIPYSEMFKAGSGECMEKAILVQMAAQRGRESYLIDGVLAVDGEVGVSHHAFNVVFRDGKPHLVDSENPLMLNIEGNDSIPYIAPVLGVRDGVGELIVPDEWKQGRTYMTF